MNEIISDVVEQYLEKQERKVKYTRKLLEHYKEMACFIGTLQGNIDIPPYIKQQATEIYFKQWED